MKGRAQLGDVCRKDDNTRIDIMQMYLPYSEISNQLNLLKIYYSSTKAKKKSKLKKISFRYPAI